MRMTKQEQIDMARAWQQQQMMNNGCGTPMGYYEYNYRKTI